MANLVSYARLKKPLYESQDDKPSWYWVYQWYDDGTVRRKPENSQGKPHFAIVEQALEIPVQWNGDEFEPLTVVDNPE